jgi:hypothetical protein
MSINLNKSEMSMEDNMLKNVISNMNAFNKLSKELEVYANSIGINNNISIIFSNGIVDFQSKNCWKDIENKNVAFDNVKEHIQDAIHLFCNLDQYNKNVSMDIPYKSLIISIIHNDITIRFAV